MFWKRPSNAAAEPMVSAPPKPEEADRALDTIAVLLRAYGEHAFDTDGQDAEQTRGECERWATRILVGGDSEEDRRGPLKRDFGGVRRFFKDRRQVESDYVGRSLGDLREAVQSFARCLKTAIADDQTMDRRVGTKITALSDAVTGGDTSAIRSHAMEVITVVRESIASREQRHAQQVQALAERLRRLQSELSAARQEASLDGLTKLYNRASFDAHVDRIADLGLLLGTPPFLMMIDVDHFKSINDTYGHPAGDEVLRQVADSLLRHFLRREDFVARYGGEEFAVVVLDVRPDDAKALAERLLRGVRGLELNVGGQRIKVRVSMGLASLVPGEGASAWVSRADRALYAAKDSGRDCARFADLPAQFD